MKVQGGSGVEGKKVETAEEGQLKRMEEMKTEERWLKWREKFPIKVLTFQYNFASDVLFRDLTAATSLT